MTARWRLRDEVRLDLIYEDRSPFGSVLGGRADDSVRQGCAAILEHRRLYGMADVVACSDQLLKAAFSGGLSPLYEAPNMLRADCLFPPAKSVRPVGLSVTGDAAAGKVTFEPGTMAELASWIGDLERGTGRPTSAGGRRLFDELEALGALEPDRVSGDPSPEGDAIFVGHATAVIGRRARAVFDPFLLPRSKRYSTTYQPLGPRDLLPLEAVFITHSHPDHFDPGTLLRLGADIPIHVPEVERESLLAVDMAARLRELGFCSVRTVRPGQRISFGDTTVHVSPFFGEQPTTSEVLHPDVRNVGCTYLFEAENRRMFLVADAGTDREGDIRNVASAVRAGHGRVDVLFGGYRAFAIYPIHYLFSSVARFVLFVPPPLWGARQKTMNDASALLDTAERCGAQVTIPYADGGAPWYWERGLGPRLDVAGVSNPAVDPRPEQVLRVAAERSSSREGPIPSPVKTLLLRPGESLVLADDGARITSGPQRLWPYTPHEWLQINAELVRNGRTALESARAVFRRLEPLLSEWRTQRRLDHFFFMRKPPDLRLRFFGDPRLRNHIFDVADELVHDGFVVRWFSSVYEPEIERFGGEQAMDAAHAWFDADTAAWLRLDRLEVQGLRTLAADRLCLAVANDLVSRTLSDRAEQAELWRAYAASYGTAEPSGFESVAPEAIASLGPLVAPEERTVLAEYREANGALSAALRGFWDRGKLSSGIRAVLGAIILFHFHRHGLDPTAHARISHGMGRALGS